MKLRTRKGVAAASLVLGASLAMPLAVYSAGPIDQSRQVITSTNKQLENSQKTIDKLHSDTTSMYERYKAAVSESKTYETYNRQLKDIVTSQGEELESLNQQIADIDVTSKQIMPLMERMIQTLDDFVQQDMPFLPQERSKRIAALYDNMRRANLTVAEKYRKILEAYQIEIEYGKTLETYQAELDGKKVNFLKIGRTSFLNQTLDKKQTQVWNKHAGQWQVVEDQEVKHSFELGMKMARKQQSPELLTILASKVETVQ